jgi:hypothetical protein
MPIARADLARERLRASLRDTPPRGVSRDWVPVAFGGGLIVAGLLLGARLFRR